MTCIPDNDDCLLAARSLRKQLKLLVAHLAGIRQGEESESVHRVRVASRRLRAVLGMFGGCWKHKQVKNWKKRIRELAGELGEARDCDVQIEFLAERLASTSDTAVVTGLARLLSHVEQERQWLQPRLLQAVDRLEKSGVLKAMGSAARRLLDADGDAAESRGESASRFALNCVRKRLKRLMGEAAGLASPQDADQHHAMRIAAKRLRYTLELARPHPSTELSAVIDSVKRLQTMLGEIHDCDVWIEKLDGFARTEAPQLHVFFGESRRINRFLPGIESLREERKSRREQVFGELAAQWQKLGDEQTWDRMMSLLEGSSVTAPSCNGSEAVAQAVAASH